MTSNERESEGMPVSLDLVECEFAWTDYHVPVMREVRERRSFSEIFVSVFRSAAMRCAEIMKLV
jgi:hypothetical protein